jgi:N-methylhydantoinase A
MLTTPLRYETSRTHIGDMSASTVEDLRSLYGELEKAARQKLEGEPADRVTMRRSAEMRYGEQIFEVDVALDGIDWQAANLLELVTQAFHRRHEELFTYASPGQEVVLVNARVAVMSDTGTAFEPAALPSSAAHPSCGRRRVHIGGDWREVSVYPMESLSPGQELAGPALIEADTTTVLLHQGDKALVNRFGWLEIDVRLA